MGDSVSLHRLRGFDVDGDLRHSLSSKKEKEEHARRKPLKLRCVIATNGEAGKLEPKDGGSDV
jgi:hypothetical protein